MIGQQYAQSQWSHMRLQCRCKCRLICGLLYCFQATEIDGASMIGSGLAVYVVTVATGAARGSGTTANVTMDILGDTGRIADRRLENNEEDFGRSR